MSEDTIQRLLYYKGQLLTAQDFEDQQNYHRQKIAKFIQRFQNGIVNNELKVTFIKALTVSGIDFDAFFIGKGLAFDQKGNPILVSPGGLALDKAGDEISITEKGLPVSVAGFDGKTPYLSLIYREIEKCAQHGCENPKKKNRMMETVQVIWLKSPNIPDPNDPEKGNSTITVAKIEFDDSNYKIIDENEPNKPPFRLDAALIGKEQIKDGAIISAKISDNAVTSAKINDGAVTSAKLDSNVQATPKDNSVTEVKIANNAVTTDKINDGAVTSVKLANDIEATPQDGSVTAAKIASNAVTTGKIHDGAVTSVKLDSTVQTTPKDGSVTEAKIANNAVTAGKIGNKAITSAKLALVSDDGIGHPIPAGETQTNIIVTTGLTEIVQLFLTGDGGPLNWSSTVQRTGNQLSYNITVINGGPATTFKISKINFGDPI